MRILKCTGTLIFYFVLHMKILKDTLKLQNICTALASQFAQKQKGQYSFEFYGAWDL